METTYKKVQTGEYEVQDSNGQKIGQVVNKAQFNVYGPNGNNWVAYIGNDPTEMERISHWFNTRKEATQTLTRRASS